MGAVTGGVLEIRGHLTQVMKEDLYREHGRIDYKMDSSSLSPNLRSYRRKQSPRLWNRASYPNANTVAFS
ncbi:hypothetical protein CEP54_010856 [Fusarium duplospermum]|uniref:Uncharacterized protein n=1 Tax=Fusarium duplospermum TaxID=1325734 RepID=A0A428PHI4_9HYPO|nr:hypothetical protein CEP54_010856 [Fusarium duplospermum]